MKIWKCFENMKSLWKYESALKIDKCPEIITGANFHFETIELCILNDNYALGILLEKKSLLQMILQTYLDYCAHFKAHYWIKSNTILESWVLLLFSLLVFTTVCSSSDIVGSVSSLCVLRCGHLLVLLLSEEEVQWSPLYQLMPRTGLPWPGCTSPAWFSWSASEKQAGWPALVSCSAAWTCREAPLTRNTLHVHLLSEPWPLIPIWRLKWGFHRGWS